jgi:hypothetical protein
MVLRFIAFRAHDPSTYREQDFDKFLRSTMVEINSWSKAERARMQKEFHLAMETSKKIFGDDAFRKRYFETDPRRPVSKALFEVVAVSIAALAADHGQDAITQLVRRAADIRQGFRQLMADDRQFDRSISQGTGDPNSVRYRFRRMAELFGAEAG